MIAPAASPMAQHRGRRLAGAEKIASNFIDRGLGEKRNFLILTMTFASFAVYRLPLRSVRPDRAEGACRRQAFVSLDR